LRAFLFQLCLTSSATAVQGLAERSAVRAAHGHLHQQPTLEEEDLPFEFTDSLSENLAKPGKVLLFWAVGSKSQSINLVRRNIDQLRAEVKASNSFDSSQNLVNPLHLDVFLAHYDRNRSNWMKNSKAASWYKQNIRYSVEESGYKMKLATHQLMQETRDGPDTKTYEWIWLLDEDADFAGMSIRTLIGDARSSGALIVGPSVKNGLSVNLDRTRSIDDVDSINGCQPGMPMCKLAEPDARCRYRYTNFVEVMFTLIKPRALLASLEGCPDCLHDNSVWGLDRTWCKIAARRLTNAVNKTCAVLDRVTVIHRNLKTLAKWNGPAEKMSETGNLDVVKAYHADMDETRLAHPLDFVEYPVALHCVPAADEEAPQPGLVRVTPAPEAPPQTGRQAPQPGVALDTPAPEAPRQTQ